MLLTSDKPANQASSIAGQSSLAEDNRPFVRVAPEVASFLLKLYKKV